MLQNLAWLDQTTGQVHTVPQHSNGGPMLLGASAPVSLGLQDLMYNGGPTRHDGLMGATARLQDLAYIGEDGQYHSVAQTQNGQKMLGAIYQPTFQNLDSDLDFLQLQNLWLPLCARWNRSSPCPYD